MSASSNKIAIVTGANKGIGLAIVRSLCKKFTGDVYLTARDEGRGHEAIKLLNGEGLSPLFHQLDITSQESVDALKKFVVGKYGGVDVLVNNAGRWTHRIQVTKQLNLDVIYIFIWRNDIALYAKRY